MSADDSGIQVAISTVLTPQLVREGMSRDFVRHVQQLRKDAGLNIQDRIAITWQSTQPAVAEMAAEWNRYICEETLADSLQQATPSSPKSVSVGDCDVQIAITRSHP
jgi:isoleucyl-tRNA synthetase